MSLQVFCFEMDVQSANIVQKQMILGSKTQEIALRAFH